MAFYPADAPVPGERRTTRVLLRPLRAADAPADYEAVMASAARLRRWSQSDWPADEFTLAENRADLERHEREHQARVAFTYTVMDPAEARCLGCVYLVPLPEALAGSGEYGCRVSLWARSSEPDDLEARLLDTLRRWLREEWAFERVRFTTSPADQPQVALFEASGLVPQGGAALPDGRWLLAYA